MIFHDLPRIRPIFRAFKPGGFLGVSGAAPSEALAFLVERCGDLALGGATCEAGSMAMGVPP